MSVEQGSIRQRRAGQHARSRANELGVRALLVIVASLLVLCVAWFAFDGRGPTLVLVELGAIGLILVADRYYAPQVDRWLQGAKGEEDVAAVLAELSADGWHALHDISLGRGNIDHVLIGPGGVFTIETKSHEGRISVNRIQPEMLKQAYAEKKLLERITSLKVQPLLVFSQAWLVGSVPTRRDGVVILPARMLQDFFSRRRPIITADRAKQLHDHLALALSSPS